MIGSTDPCSRLQHSIYVAIVDYRIQNGVLLHVTWESKFESSIRLPATFSWATEFVVGFVNRTIRINNIQFHFTQFAWPLIKQRFIFFWYSLNWLPSIQSELTHKHTQTRTRQFTRPDANDAGAARLLLVLPVRCFCVLVLDWYSLCPWDGAGPYVKISELTHRQTIACGDMFCISWPAFAAAAPTNDKRSTTLEPHTDTRSAV